MITNKIAICVFWEKNGILRDYVEYYLKGLQQIAKKILVVVNGKISSDSICKLNKLNIEYIIRENKGLDFAGYKAGIEHIGYDVLKEYDSLILTNTTVMVQFTHLMRCLTLWKNALVIFGVLQNIQNMHKCLNIFSHISLFSKKICL